MLVLFSFRSEELIHEAREQTNQKVLKNVESKSPQSLFPMNFPVYKYSSLEKRMKMLSVLIFALN